MKNDVEVFGQLLGETARSWRYAMDRQLRPIGLSGARWRVLLHLARSPEPLTQKQLAHRAGVEGPTLAALLDRMEKDGWIARETPERDRRTKQVRPTPRAHDVIDRIEATATALRHELLAGLTDEDIQRCMDVLVRIRNAADAAG